MKKVIYPTLSLSLLLGCFYLPASAGQPHTTSQLSTSPLHRDWRIGLGAAAEYINIESNLKIDSAPGFQTNLKSTQSHTGKNLQIAPSIELGKTISNNYYLGVFLSWRSKVSATNLNGPTRGHNYFVHNFKINQSTDILLKPGYKFTPQVLIYGLIGPTIAKWNHTTLLYRHDSVYSQFNTDNTSVGLGIGVGFEYLIQKKYAFSLDYTHHFHSTKTQKQSMSQLVTLPPILVPQVFKGDVTKKVTPSYATIAARFTYYFNL